MSTTSLIKFMGEEKGNGRGPLHWGRADIDGAPFRGQLPPNLTAEEFESRLTRVNDPQNGIFDVSDERQNKMYLAVMDKIVNGRAQCLAREKQWDPDKKTWLIYVEWMIPFMEDGKPMFSQQIESEG